MTTQVYPYLLAVVVFGPALVMVLAVAANAIRYKSFTRHHAEAFAVFFPPIYVMYLVGFWTTLVSGFFSKKSREEFKREFLVTYRI